MITKLKNDFPWKSSKKLSQLKSLFQSLEELYDFDSKSIKPKKSSTRWIDHKAKAMTKLNDKFGVYAKQIENSIEQTPKASDKATLRGKLNRLTTADVLLRSAFLTDILEPVKILSLVSQKKNINAGTRSSTALREKSSVFQH